MNTKHYTALLLAVAAMSATALTGCKRIQDEQPTPEGSLPAVAIAPTLAQSDASGKAGAVSRLTPSTSSAAGAFEPNDKVGLFLYDENAAAFSTSNMCYTADATLVFVPTTKVYYKTYYQHGLYAYYPYNASVSNAKALTFALQKDQTTAANRIKCDFLSSGTTNIKPQQIDPNAPEIPMAFYHQMTSIVVRVKNGDGSALSDDLTAKPVKVWGVQRSTNAELDLTVFTKDATTGYEAVKFNSRTKDPVRANNRVFLGHNATKDVGTTMYFEGILIPEAVVATDTLFKVQIGTDGAADTRVFAYIPKAGDPIVTSGLAQGKEHIFDLTIKGTQLLVQGGEIVDWGTGTTTSQTINGGGVTSTRLIFELTGESAEPQTDQITKCKLYLDGTEYAGEATYTAASGPNKARITCSINTGFSFPYWFTQAVFLDAANNTVWNTTIVGANVIRIKGNPLDPAYNTTLAVIDVATKQPTPVP